MRFFGNEIDDWIVVLGVALAALCVLISTGLLYNHRPVPLDAGSLEPAQELAIMEAVTPPRVQQRFILVREEFDNDGTARAPVAVKSWADSNTITDSSNKRQSYNAGILVVGDRITLRNVGITSPDIAIGIYMVCGGSGGSLVGDSWIDASTPK